MFNKMREKQYIAKIKKEMDKTSMLKYISLNSLKSAAASDLLNGKISEEFYYNVFGNSDMYNHYTEVNYDYIMSYQNN